MIGLAAIALTLPTAGYSVVNLDDLTPTTLADFDSRDAAQPSAAQLSAANALGANVEWNSLGTPASIIKYGGYVATGISAPDAATAARQWLDANATLFALGSTSSLTVWSDAPLVGSDTYAVTFRQSAGGQASTDGVATVAVVGSSRSGWKVVYASSTLAPDQSPTGSFSISPSTAYANAASAAGVPGVSAFDVQPMATKAGITTLDVDGIKGEQSVEKSRFVTPSSGARAAYEATVDSTASDGSATSYAVVVDAQTGDLLYRQNLVDNASDNPTWNAWPIAPQTTPFNKFPWGYPSNDLRQLWCWTALSQCQYQAQDASTVYPLGVASKMAWDVNPNTTTGADLGTHQPTGNNVDEARLWSGGHGAFGNPALYRPTSATRDYRYPFTNAWYTSGCNPANLTGNGNDIDAAEVNLFAMHNRMHDFSYYLGFDEPHWNAQQWNNGLGGLGNDGVLGNAQSGALTGSRDNANMSTGGDGPGGRPQTNMFLWQSLAGAFYAPCVDGDYDMTVIGHEFGHAIENRMIGKGVGARQGIAHRRDGRGVRRLRRARVPEREPLRARAQLGSVDRGRVRHRQPGQRHPRLPRPTGRWAASCRSPAAIPETDPLNLSDYGFDIVGPEVHADGEIWVAVEYDIRQLFLDRYPSQGVQRDIDCARGQFAVTQCPGDRRWIQDYYDSMVLMPRNATILQARDAMLAADQARFGGANLDLLWHAFAQRGFGQSAFVTSNADTDPVPDFSSPLANNATLTFSAVAADGSTLPVKARIYVGDYQARVEPDRRHRSGDHEHGHGREPRRHRAVRAERHGREAPRHVQLRRGRPGLRPRPLHGSEHRPLASRGRSSSSSGRTSPRRRRARPRAGDGTNQASLIDDDEATVWNSANAPVAGQQVVVDLAGTAPVNLRWANVSAFLTPANNRFTALRSFALYACTAGKDPANPTCNGTNTAGWKKLEVSQDDAFPSVNPRPIGPDMTLRGWQLPSTTATHVKLVVLTNQCTGQTSYQGDQDKDPANNADCRTGTGTSRANEVHAAELQLFSSAATVSGRGVVNVDT